jgi:hypothetical protein
MDWLRDEVPGRSAGGSIERNQPRRTAANVERPGNLRLQLRPRRRNAAREHVGSRTSSCRREQKRGAGRPVHRRHVKRLREVRRSSGPLLERAGPLICPPTESRVADRHEIDVAVVIDVGRGEGCRARQRPQANRRMSARERDLGRGVAEDRAIGDAVSVEIGRDRDRGGRADAAQRRKRARRPEDSADDCRPEDSKREC